MSGVVGLPTLRSEIVEKVAEYLMYKDKYANSKDLVIPDFGERVPPEIALELYVPRRHRSARRR